MAEHANAFLLLTMPGLVTVLLIFGMKYFSAGRQARLRFVSEGAFGELAEKGVAAQSSSAASPATMQVDLTEVKSKLIAIEKVLREVR